MVFVGSEPWMTEGVVTQMTHLAEHTKCTYPLPITYALDPINPRGVTGVGQGVIRESSGGLLQRLPSQKVYLNW